MGIFLYLCRIIENIVIMTKANKVLFITQEITPYVSESEMSLVGRNLPQAIQEKGREIRTFMPKWGNINERRNQRIGQNITQAELVRISQENLHSHLKEIVNKNDILEHESSSTT